MNMKMVCEFGLAVALGGYLHDWFWVVTQWAMR
jgi:hypothetical protein